MAPAASGSARRSGRHALKPFPISPCTLSYATAPPSREPGVAPGPPPNAGYSLALLSWSLFLAIFLVELGAYSPATTWLWRFPIFLVFAGQLAKLK
jgi:hypothetical protein